MSLATLMAFPQGERAQNAWSFDHAMAHRGLLAVMGPLHQWSAIPYFVDPQQFRARPTDPWNLNHQQAHNDYNKFLPAYALATDGGISQSQILVEHDFRSQDGQPWWTFANHQEHRVASGAIHPLPGDGRTDTPWWATGSRRVPRFW